MSGIPSWEVKGASVVCIGNTPDPTGIEFGDDPIIGETYTISRVGLAYGEGEPIISLAELPTIHPVFGEIGSLLCDFRPAVRQWSLEQDVAIFAPLLDQVPEVA